MSKVEICNQGLSTYLGQSRITSFEQDLPQAEECKLHYDPALKHLLEFYDWDFASGREALAALENDRTDEWSFKYQRPGSALKIRWVNVPSVAKAKLDRDEDPDTPRQNVGTSIYSNVSGAYCEFTKWITDTTKFPQHFVDALAANVAARCAMPLTEDARRTQNASNMAMMKLGDAIRFEECNRPVRTLNRVADALAVRGI